MDSEPLRIRIRAISARMREAPTKEALACIIAEEVATYTLLDLLEIRATLERELRYVPAAYRAKLQPKMREHFFGMHHTIMTGYHSGRFDGHSEPVEGKLGDFCDMLAGVPDADEGWDFRLALLYYLISAFAMFVRGLPGHPVGTPFPGGFSVELRDGTYWCPVREKEDEVKTSICPFCPARQSSLPGDEPVREADG